MGTNSSSPQTLLNDYTFEKTSNNNGASILIHKKTGCILLLRQISTTSQSDLNALLEKSYKRKGLNHEHYLTLQDIFQKSEGTFCSTVYKSNLLYQYGNHTLQHEIETRIDENRSFEEKQLWSIVCSCVLALAFLLRQNIDYQMISPNDIFLDNQGIVKIPDPDLASGTFNGGFSIRTTNYFSPESLQGRYNSQKSSVFSLGICMLQTMLLQSMSICYNYQDGKLDPRQLNYKIQQLKNTSFNLALISIVQSMLIIDFKKRPGIIDLEDKLFKLMRQQQSSPLQPKTPSHSNVQKKTGDSYIQQQILSEKLIPIVPQNQQIPSIIVQLFEHFDIQYPDDAQEQSQNILTDRSNKTSFDLNIIQPITQKKNIIPQNGISFDKQNNKREEVLFTDPHLLQMLRKDMQQINLKKSRQLENQISTDLSIKIDSNHFARQSRISSITAPMKSYSQIDVQLRFVSQSYERGRYDGQKKGNQRQGYGTFLYKDGGKYTGYWKNNKMHGKGTLYYANNKIAYEGDWVQDHLWGYGVLYNQDPQILKRGYDYKSFEEVDQYWINYQGNFVQDNKCGKGKLILSNNQIFEGSFQNQLVHGWGIFYTKQGKVIRGEWSENKLIKQLN